MYWFWSIFSLIFAVVTKQFWPFKNLFRTTSVCGTFKCFCEFECKQNWNILNYKQSGDGEVLCVSPKSTWIYSFWKSLDSGHNTYNTALLRKTANSVWVPDHGGVYQISNAFSFFPVFPLCVFPSRIFSARIIKFRV